ncbi:uncharacterized protein J3R85_014112 [Psidium guajava]|nr:uncharacterized protein J3R85_014112 [Psidium guajava]
MDPEGRRGGRTTAASPQALSLSLARRPCLKNQRLVPRLSGRPFIAASTPASPMKKNRSHTTSNISSGRSSTWRVQNPNSRPDLHQCCRDSSPLACTATDPKNPTPISAKPQNGDPLWVSAAEPRAWARKEGMCPKKPVFHRPITTLSKPMSQNSREPRLRRKNKSIQLKMKEEDERSLDDVYSQLKEKQVPRTNFDTKPASDEIVPKLPKKMRKSGRVKSPFAHFEEKIEEDDAQDFLYEGCWSLTHA